MILGKYENCLVVYCKSNGKKVIKHILRKAVKITEPPAQAFQFLHAFTPERST